MGFAVAREAWLRGAQVTLITGPSALPDPVGVRTVRVEDARQMLDEARAAAPMADVLVFAAAVADFRPSEPFQEKWKRVDAGPHPTIGLSENPDVAVETLRVRKAGAVAVGFALETTNLLVAARAKLEAKDFDLVVANDPGEEDSGFEVETNRVTFIDRDGGEEALPLLTKDDVATRLVDRVRERIASRDRRAVSGQKL
jgi:phosphopantothenoylcysteine decarboxylase/phosphopantothenate--cysteine ligase